MNPLRSRNQKLQDKNKFQIVRPPPLSAFDDTTSSLKDNSMNIKTPQKYTSEPISPSEEVCINFQTDNQSRVDTPSHNLFSTGDVNLLSRTTTVNQAQGDRLTSAPDELLYEEILDDDIIMRLISNLVFYVLRINAISLILFGILTLVITWEISYLYSVGFLWAIDLFELVQMLVHSRKYRATTPSKLKKILSYVGPLFKTFGSAGSKALLVFYIHFKPFPLMACLAPGALYEIFSSLSAIYKNKKKFLKNMHLCLLIVKSMLTLSFVAAALKVEKGLTWHWREVLLSYWILFALLSGITLIAFLCLINRCCIFFFADNDQFQVYGVLWVVFVLGGKTALSCIMILNLQDTFDHHLPSVYSDNLLTSLFIIMSYNLVILLFTLGYYTEIENFFKDLAAVEDECEQTLTYGMDTKEESQPKKFQKIVVPKFLTKSSSTYYRITTDSEIKQVKKKRKDRTGDKGKSKQVEKKEPNNTPNQIANHKVQEPAKMVKEFTGKIEIPHIKSTKNDMLLTIAETDQDKGSCTEIDKRSMISSNTGKREDKGKDFFSGLTNRTGVLGIVPSVMRGIGLAFKGKKDYAEQQDQDDEFGDRRAAGNQSYDFHSKRKRSIDKEGESISLRLRKTDRGQLKGKGLEALEAKLRDLESEHDRGKKSKEKMSNSACQKSEGHLNLSAMLEQDHSNDSSLVDETMKPKSGDTSMAQQCLICFDRAPDAVFMECGHGGVCYECSVEVWKAAGECYLCRNKIIQVLQIDLKSKLGDNVIKVLSSTQMVNWE